MTGIPQVHSIYKHSGFLFCTKQNGPTNKKKKGQGSSSTLSQRHCWGLANPWHQNQPRTNLSIKVWSPATTSSISNLYSPFLLDKQAPKIASFYTYLPFLETHCPHSTLKLWSRYKQAAHHYSRHWTITYKFIVFGCICNFPQNLVYAFFFPIKSK